MKEKQDPFFVTLPFPPSINHYWSLIPMGNRARMIVNKRGKDFRKEVKHIIGDVGCKTSNLAVTIEAHVPDNRRRDIDNLLKAPLDALQHAGVYKDDCLIDDLHIKRIRGSAPDKRGSLFVRIDEI